MYERLGKENFTSVINRSNYNFLKFDISGIRTFRTLFDLASDWLMVKWSVLIDREKRSRD